jgi:prepilin-type N-terminal cleavage/methylation domain-containing protein
MKAKKGRGIGFLLNNQGFTLIEMAIVLIIIGIIIGAVVKGKDLVRSAEQKRLYAKFVNTWEMAYNAYYDRTGWILGDDNTPNNATRDGRCSSASCANLVAQLKAVGLEVPTQGPSGSECDRQYTDSLGTQHTLTIVFTNASDDQANNYNYIQIATIPNELGIAWDRMIDGENSGDTGSFIYIPSTAAPVRTSWPSAQTAPVAGSEARLLLSF